MFSHKPYIRSHPASSQAFCPAMQPVEVERFSQQQHGHRQKSYHHQEDLQPCLWNHTHIQHQAQVEPVTTQTSSAQAQSDTVGTRYASRPYLSRVERGVVPPLHEEHVDEVDEDAGSQAGISGSERHPFIEDHEDQVAEKTQQEQQLWEEQQVDVELLPEVPGRTEEK